MNRVLGEKGIHLAKQYRAKGMGLKEAVANARIALLRPHQSVGIEEKHTVTSVPVCFFCDKVETKRTAFFRMRLQNNKYIPGAGVSAGVCEEHRKSLAGEAGLFHEGKRYQGFAVA